jgi:hypothetical protein
MATNWAGYAGIEQEHAVLSLSVGPILDRRKQCTFASTRVLATTCERPPPLPWTNARP